MQEPFISLVLPIIGFGQQTAIELFHWDDTTLVLNLITISNF
tara:strand:+ start:853 stop:978 length:126 start_codon:yes stop_codon:yes gene_type:complete